MLILERTLESSIRIGSDIRIKVVDVIGKRRVRLGLEVPRGTLIWREELGSPKSPGSAVGGKPELRVFIVEDDPTHVKLIQKAFKRAGSVETRVAGDGATAIAALTGQDNAEIDLDDELRDFDPHLVVLDLQLPDTDGHAVLDTLRDHELTRNLPIVMLSSMSEEQQVSRAIEAGANAFLAKTDDYNQFCDNVIRIAEFWRLNRAGTLE